MHRHGYKGRKFGRETDQRQALMRGLIRSLLINQSITTTTAKAKEMRRFTEKLISIAKKPSLSNRRLLISRINDIEVANLLMDEIAPQVKRDSGYLRVKPAGRRKGDNAEMSTISFVDTVELKAKEEPKVEKKTEKKAEKPAEKKPATKKEAK